MRGSIIRQGKGSWALRASAGFDPVTGKRKRVFRTFRGSKREAEAALAALIHEVATGTDLDPGRLSAGEYLMRWLGHARTRIRPRTWTTYETYLRRHVVPVIGNVPLSKLRPSHVQAVVDRMTAVNKAPRTIVQTYAVLHSALRQARRWQLISANPAEAVRPPRPARAELAILDPTGLRRLLDAAKATPQEASVTTAVATGLRRGELLGLRWREVDLEAAKIRVTVTLQRHRQNGQSELVLAEPKTDRARREIALPAFAIETLRHHRKDQAERRLMLGEGWRDLDLVFDRGDGGPLDPDAFGQAVQRIAARAGLNGMRLHDVRHGFATTLLASGVHPKIASEALGHASVAFTLDTYSHVVPGMQKEAAAAMERVLGN